MLLTAVTLLSVTTSDRKLPKSRDAASLLL